MLLRAKHFFCQKPFEWFEVFPDGTVYVCCPSWLRQSIGNLFEQDLLQIWNSPEALAIRRSILDRSYTYCDKIICPYLNSFDNEGMSIVEYMRSKHKSLIYRNESLKEAPHTIACSFDRSCNLSCPSCRNELISLKKDSEEMKKVMTLQSKILDVLPLIKKLHITGSGDPFASHVFYNLLRGIDLNKCPQLEIQLISNGIMLKQRWGSISNIHAAIKSLEISIDAASSEVYQTVRRGGDFSKLMESLLFVSNMRKRNMIKYWRISFVVQTKNFHQMPDFVELGKKLGADSVFFLRMLDWGHMGNENFIREAITEKEHPRHRELLILLNNPIFDDPVCELGNLNDLRHKQSQNVDF